MFDYNLDFFSVGALDDDAWKLDDGPIRYAQRALAARGGLWGNHGYEAAYAMVYLDGDGNALDGANRYELCFDREPPVGAFWSVTMYDDIDFLLVANQIDRYSIGDRTPGLQRDADGGLTIVMQRDEPAEPERAGSGRSCACTNQTRPCSTAGTNCRRFAESAERPPRKRQRSLHTETAAVIDTHHSRRRFLS